MNCSTSVSLRAARSTECNADCPTAPTIDEVQLSIETLHNNPNRTIAILPRFSSMAAGRPPPSFLASARPTRSPCSRESLRLRYRKYKCFHLEHFQPVDFYTGHTHGIVRGSQFRKFFFSGQEQQYTICPKENITTKSTTVAILKLFLDIELAQQQIGWNFNQKQRVVQKLQNRSLQKKC